MKQYMTLVVAFLVSFLFAIGLGISGMTQPKNVVGFLDIFREWQPDLLFVMIGAILVYGPFQYFFAKRKPILSKQYHLPRTKLIDKKLILGSALFGIGWGIGGYCPGPALTAVFSFSIEPLIFVSTLILGIKVFQVWNAQTANPKAVAHRLHGDS